MTWRPVLEGDARNEVLETVRAIADALRSPSPGERDTCDASGRAVLYAYVASAGLGGRAPAEEWMDRALDGLADAEEPALFGGATGVAWAAEQVWGSAGPSEDPNDDFDATLLEHVSVTPWRTDYDLVAGLVGFGVYALERLHHPRARELLEEVVRRLRELAVPMERGLAWLTPPDLLRAETARENPEGYYNAGLAHGVPGVIALLGQAIEAGVAAELALPLLRGAVEWVLSLRRKASDGSWFPTWVPKHRLAAGVPDHGCRGAWCYGDPGVAIALFSAARAAREPTWEHAALAIARDGLARPVEKVGVRDAGICHGAVGLAHIYNRLWQSTRDPTFLDAARTWYARTLAMREPGAGVAGFRAWAQSKRGVPFAWADDTTFLTGAAGVALALLAAASDVAPLWDRVLLTAVRPIEPLACWAEERVRSSLDRIRSQRRIDAGALRGRRRPR